MGYRGRRQNSGIQPSIIQHFKMRAVLVLLLGTILNLCEGSVHREDHEPPVLVKCPDDIVVKTDQSFATVGWEEPIYTDNCGDVTKCLQIKSQYQNPIRVPVGLTYLIKYLAIDRNHNVNAECEFTIQVKTRGCDGVDPPVNGVIIQANGLYQARCTKPYFPKKAFAYFYRCLNDKLVDMFNPSSVLTKFDPCVHLKPPGRPITHIDLMLQYEGDCNKKAVQMSIKEGFKTDIGGRVPVSKISIH